MQFVIKNDDIAKRCCQAVMASLGKTVVIKETKRTNPQNALYWSVLTIIAGELGMEPEELHDEIKVRFLGVKKRVVHGQELIEPISTTTLSKKQFGELIDKVYALAGELNIKIPSPDYWGLECTG